DEKSYLSLGYSSMDEFGENHYRYSRAHMWYMIGFADRIFPLLPTPNIGVNGKTPKIGVDGNDQSANVALVKMPKGLEALKKGDFRRLSELEDAYFQEVINDATINDPVKLSERLTKIEKEKREKDKKIARWKERAK
ncbi:hypothetical protein GWN75_14095, partial [candidate division KSB1 bacterium]|nr:hypothetical protein [candidate division KSB1 bacterium]NIV04155.1 hypothetical protein [Calditrichia bacterium]NIS24976.1 hypothetical protein [candidate division KSB1 bacterium]NIU25631.1 hypothetical protein [candidate division KSB1 bacterium]NIV71724.1 hypothetical protein [Calditrichia bacterium]